MEHVEGKFTFKYISKIVTSKIGKLFTVHDAMMKTLKDMKLIDSEHMWDRILENNDVRNQIYAIIESVPPYLKISSTAASGRTLSENVQEVKELLVDLNLFDSEHVWKIILKSDDVKNQIYAMLESVGHFQ